jgi:sugar phosphate isomerase/epimerase
MVKAGIVGFVPDGGKEGENAVWERLEFCAKIGYRAMDMDMASLFPGGDLKENYKRAKDIGIKPLMSGIGSDLFEILPKKLEELRVQEIDRVCMYSSSILDSYNFGDIKPGGYDAMMKDFEFMNKAVEALSKEGFILLYHNHFQEFATYYGGASAFDHMPLKVDDRLQFNLDVGWAMVSGNDPVAALKRIKGRIGGIHMKDFYETDRSKPMGEQAFTSLGSGLLNIDAVLAEMDSQGVKYACVEQDKLRNLNAEETLRASYLRMKESGYVM